MSILEPLFFLAGLICFCYGLFLIYAPLSLLFAGSVFLYLAVASGRR